MDTTIPYIAIVTGHPSLIEDRIRERIAQIATDPQYVHDIMASSIRTTMIRSDYILVTIPYTIVAERTPA